MSIGWYSPTRVRGLRLAGLGLTLGLAEGLENAIFPGLAGFVVEPAVAETAEYHLHLSLEAVNATWLDTGFEAAPQSWHYEQQGDESVLCYRPPLVLGGGWTHELRLNLAQQKGWLRVANPTGQSPLDYLQVFPDRLDKYIFTAMLNAQGSGCLIHGAAVVDRGEGILLAGQSGAGKSTSSRLWLRYGGTVLTDECSLIRPDLVGGFEIFGTPWHSSAEIANPESAPLKRIYFLQHGSCNKASPVDRQTALLRLLAQGHFSFWDSAGVGVGLETVIALSQVVPAFGLEFVPNASVVEYVRGLGIGNRADPG